VKLSSVVAANVRHFRRVDGLTQQDLADQMRQRGQGWFRATTSEVERERRRVTVDELAALAEVLGVSVALLLCESVACNAAAGSARRRV
jgi:transcriptional regulator with XRE-family HTH domain